MIRVADYIMKYLSEQHGIKHIFVVTGGGSMQLDDALGKNKNIEYICTHHEQSLAMAVEAYARVKNSLGVGVVTTGPGGTNALTGVVGAWMDSTPCLFLSGQISLKDTILNTGLRQRGVQEADIISIVKSVTKYAVLIKDPNEVKYHLQKALYLATHGRAGPVWLDIPLDVQGALIDENKLKEFDPTENTEVSSVSPAVLKENVSKLVGLLKSSDRPLLWVGNGIRLSGALDDFFQLAQKLKIPICTTWNAADFLDNNDPLYVGRPGLFGQRAANFAVQNADLLITIGNRLSIPQTGFNFAAFARGAKKVFVDIDNAELINKPFKADIPINADAKAFLNEFISQLKDYRQKNISNWFGMCKAWKEKYPVVLPAYLEQKKYVSSYVFADMLSDKLGERDVIVTDMGTSFTTTFQAFKVKKGQRFFTSSGLASMGFGLPGAIGACFANNKKRTICIAGEGSFMFNLQELQTVVHHKLPIKIFLLNNGVYLSIKAMQDSNFQSFYVGSEPKSGVSFPDFIKVAKSFGFKTERIKNQKELKPKLKKVLSAPGPFFCEVLLNPDEVLQPRLKSKLFPGGKMAQSPLEDMWPFLDREELKSNMVIPLLDEPASARKSTNSKTEFE